MSVSNETVKPDATADLLHSAAIRLLRRLRTSDLASGLTAAQASVLSVLIFGGPQTISQLAAIEQVRLPTISRLITEMERARLVTRQNDRRDGRVSIVAPTAKARTLFAKARELRLGRLQNALATRSLADRAKLHQAALVILDLAKTLE